MGTQDQTVKNGVMIAAFICFLGAVGYLVTHFTNAPDEPNMLWSIGGYIYTGWRGFIFCMMAVAACCGGMLILVEIWKLLRNPETRRQTILWIFAAIGVVQTLKWIGSL